jgi:hypothetical protein
MTRQQRGGGTLSYIMVKHTVADYFRWKQVFDVDGANRQARGSRGGQVVSSAEDCNEVVILVASDLERARKFSRGEEARAKMQDAGALAPPEFTFLEVIEQLSR